MNGRLRQDIEAEIQKLREDVNNEVGMIESATNRLAQLNFKIQALTKHLEEPLIMIRYPRNETKLITPPQQAGAM